MNSKLAIAVSLLAILLLSFAGSAFGETKGIGVQEGDYYIYHIVTHYDTANSTFPVPEAYVEFNATDNYKVMVTAVQYTNVTRTNIWHFNNGSQDQTTLVVQDIMSGTMYYPMAGFEGIYEANLTAGDLLRPSAGDNIRINQTINRDYSSGSRQTNVITITQPELDIRDNTNTTLGTGNYTYMIDRLTGVVVERIDTSTYADHSGTLTWTLVDTNRWDVSGGSSSSSDPWLSLPVIGGVVAVVVVVVAVAGFVVYRKRQGNRRRH